MEAPLWYNGPTPGAFYNFPGHSATAGVVSNYTLPDFSQRSQTPITTTTTVIGVRFNRGVVVAADTLGSYGSLARFRDCPRVLRVNDRSLLGCGGDYADYQYLKDIIEQKIIDERCTGDGLQLKPRSLHCWLTRVLYNKRSKFDPLWSSYVVAGMQDGVPFLGAVDKLGTAHEDAAIATGLGAYMATPLLRAAAESGRELTLDAANRICVDMYRMMTAEHHSGTVIVLKTPLSWEAKYVDANSTAYTEKLALVLKCLEVLFYRDARSFPRYQIGVVTAEGVTVEDTKELKHDWQLAHMINMK